MIRRLLRDALFENGPLKLAALSLAVVLFAVVRGDRQAVTAVHAKVVYLYPPDRVLVSDPVSELRITVRGPSNRLGRLNEHDLDAVRVDLRDAREGELRFGEEMVRLPGGLRVESITPSGMQVRFEPRVERQVPVQPVLAGDPAPGHRVARTTCEPRTVMIAGARSLVEQIARVPTRPLHIDATRESVRGEVDLAPPPPHVEWHVDGPVSVAVEVVLARGEVVLPAVPVRIGSAQRLDAWVEPAQVEVVLRGPLEAIERARAAGVSLLVDAQPEEVRPPVGPVRKRVAVGGLPVGVAAEVRPDSVTLFIRRHRD